MYHRPSSMPFSLCGISSCRVPVCPSMCTHTIPGVMCAGADSADKTAVPPPWPVHVHGLWLLSGPKLTQPYGSMPEAVEWECKQIQQKRIAALHLKLDVSMWLPQHTAHCLVGAQAGTIWVAACVHLCSVRSHASFKCRYADSAC